MSIKDPQMIRWLKKAGFNLESDEVVQFLHFCTRGAPVTKPMLPKLLALLRIFHESNRKVNMWYFAIQDSIKLHFRTQGNCLFFNGFQQIMNGEKDFDWEDAFNKVTSMMIMMQHTRV
jgi:hypothetical protein